MTLFRKRTKPKPIPVKAEIVVEAKAPPPLPASLLEALPAPRVEALPFSNPKLPDLNCSSCAVASSCPMARPGFKCAYLPYINSHKIKAPAAIIAYLFSIVDSELQRLQRALIMEKVSGGLLDKEVSNRADATFAKLDRLRSMTEEPARPGAGGKEGLAVVGEKGIVERLFGSWLRKDESNPAEKANDRHDSTE